MTDTRQHLADRQASGRTLASGITHLLLSGLAANICLFLANLAMIHAYGRAVHGGVVWLYSVASITVGLCDLGIASAAASRSIARLRAAGDESLGRSVATWISLQVLLGIVGAGAMLALAGTIADPRVGIGPGEVRIAAAWVLGMTALRACAMVVVGFEMMRETILISPVVELARLLVVIVAWMVGVPADHIVWILAAWAGCYALAVAVAAWRVRLLVSRTHSAVTFSAVRPRDMLDAAGAALPYFVPFLGLFCLPFAAQMLIGRLVPGVEIKVRGDISVFQVCFSLAMTVRLISGPIAGALLPRVAHIDASHADHTQTADILRQSARLLGTASTLLFAGAVAFGEPALRIIYGQAYAAGIDTLLVLLAFGAIDSYAMPLDQVLKATRHVGIVAALEAARYVIILAICWWAIPARGFIGAAWAILAASLATLLVKMWATRGVSASGAVALAATGAILAMLAVLHLLTCGHWLALPAWLAASIALRLLRPAEMLRWTRLIGDSLTMENSRD
jgi:O-antigen/teichoic acid export membrane protein